VKSADEDALKLLNHYNRALFPAEASSLLSGKGLGNL